MEKLTKGTVFFSAKSEWVVLEDEKPYGAKCRCTWSNGIHIEGEEVYWSPTDDLILGLGKHPLNETP